MFNGLSKFCNVPRDSELILAKMSKVFFQKGRQGLPKQGQSLFDVISEYSEYSTIQGVIYIFQSDQSQTGKLFWLLVIISMLILGTYWSIGAYQVGICHWHSS